MSGIEWGSQFLLECVSIFVKGLIGFSVLAFIISFPFITFEFFKNKEKT